MKPRARWWSGIGALALLAGGAWWWHDDHATRFLPADTTAFVARFEATVGAPPARDSTAARAELDELLAFQRARSDTAVIAAQADRKTEITRFYSALGFAADPPELPHLQRLAQRVEDDVRIYVRALKDHYRRLRPYEIEPRLEPCIGDVKGDRSYPSGHAAYAWAMAAMLSDLAPERHAELEARALEFARQRMVCGVHFPSDLAAGRQAAARIMESIRMTKEYAAESADAAEELRAALGLAPQRPASVR